MINFLSWTELFAYSITLLMVIFVTQLTKDLRIIKHVPTQIWSYISALILLFGTNFFLGGLSLNLIVPTIFNALIISLAANGAYVGIQKIFGLGAPMDGSLTINASDPNKDIYMFNIKATAADLIDKEKIILTVLSDDTLGNSSHQ